MRTYEDLRPQGLPRADVPLPPLDEKVFVARLARLTSATRSLEKLRRAFINQNPEYADGLSRGPSRPES